MCNEKCCCSLGLNILLTMTGDPQELFIVLVNTHFLEMQLLYGFGMTTTGTAQPVKLYM